MRCRRLFIMCRFWRRRYSGSFEEERGKEGRGEDGENGMGEMHLSVFYEKFL
jgi:hypothetical protein